MNFKKTIAALVLLASLGGVLYYLNKHPENKPSDTTTEKKKLFSFQPADVKEFTIEAQAAPPKDGDAAKAATPASAAPAAITVRRAAEKNQWEIASPAGVPADSTQVQSFVDALSKYEYTPLESQTPASLGEYGLDPPQKIIQFSLNSGQTAKLSVGKDNPGGYAKYATLSTTSSNPPGLFLLDSVDSKDLVDKTIFDLRDKRILSVAVDKAKKIELKFDLRAADPAEIEKAKKLGLPVKPARIAMTHEANGNWQLNDPPARTDFGDTNYFVTAVNGGVMTTVEDENPKSLAPFGLDRPAIRLEVTAEDGSTHTLLVGKKKEAKKPAEDKKDDKKDAEKKEPPKSDENLGYFAKNLDRPPVFTINQSVYDQLNQDLDNYRNRFLFDFEASNARRVELQGPTGELRLEKKGDDWFKGADGKQKADFAKVSTFLDAIHALRIQHFTEDRPGHLADYGLDKPWMKVKVTFSESNKEETVLFGQKNKKFYAGRADSPSVFELAPTEPEELEKKLKDLSS